MATKAEKIVAGLGGIDNIEEIEGCITRLRTEVSDASLVDEAALKAAGAHGVVKMGTAIQVVIGTDADPIAAEIEDMMLTEGFTCKGLFPTRKEPLSHGRLGSSACLASTAVPPNSSARSPSNGDGASTPRAPSSSPSATPRCSAPPP